MKTFLNEVIPMKPIRFLLLLLLLLLVAVPALAEDVCVVEDARAASTVTTDRSYLRVCCPSPGEGNVTLTIRDAWGGLVYQRDYGASVGAFRSEDVYLRLDGASSEYDVTLACGGESWRFRVICQQPWMTDSTVCAQGLPLNQVNGTRGNKSVVILDAYMLEGGEYMAPLVSGGAFLGYAYFTVEDGCLTVTAELTVTGQIEKSTVYIARDAVTVATLGSNRFSGTKTQLGRSVDLRGTPYAAVLVQLTVSYDPATVQAWEADPWVQEEQENLWELMLLTTANEAVG